MDFLQKDHIRGSERISLGITASGARTEARSNAAMAGHAPWKKNGCQGALTTETSHHSSVMKAAATAYRIATLWNGNGVPSP